MINYYFSCFNKYADFTGRARRMEYWSFLLFNAIAAIVAMILDILLGLTFVDTYGPFYMIYGLATFIPGLAVTVRRLHDVGKSGWYYLIALIPLVGAILLLVWLFTDSKPGANKWGPNPKEMAIS